MTVTEALLESWDRQCQMVNAVASRVDESNKNAKPSEDGWPLYRQLAHIHKVRIYFLNQIDKEAASKQTDTFRSGWSDPIDDLEVIKRCLGESAQAIRDAVSAGLEEGVEKFGPYDNPVLCIQHHVWHEGWHVGLMMLALRLNGQEPPEQWEEENIWGRWSTEEWE